ncbi:MAG: hypothetical protein AB1567_10315, partial [bacterium]
FFRNFNQFYKKRCGFSSVGSAKRGLLCFLVMYLFLQQPGSGKAMPGTIDIALSPTQRSRSLTI